MATATRNVDWFVAPTGARGDGSRERPFHAPWVALRRAQPGDTIHLAAGTNYGRVAPSSRIIECHRLSVLCGYTRDFTTRTPWQRRSDATGPTW